MSARSSGLLRGRDAFHTVHIAALALCAIMLPWSTAFLSMAQMLLVLNWLAEGVVRKELGERFRKAFTVASSAIFLSFFVLHAIGLLWTTDMAWGTALVRILLPVLSFGAVLSSAPRLQQHEFHGILLLGAWSAVVSTFSGILFPPTDASDYRSLSIFISHIRLSLLLCMAIVVFALDRRSKRWLRYAGHAAAIWSVVFINKLGSIQGYIILAVVGAVLVWRSSVAWHAGLRWITRVVLIAVPSLFFILILQQFRDHQRLPDAASLKRMERTAGGEIYTHDPTNPQMENGNHVWTYVAMGELRNSWNARSERSLDDKDDHGHYIWSTLIRYMASKGLHKDSVGLMALKDAELRAIEQGVTSAQVNGRSGLQERLDEVLFELEHYRTYGKADGHSVAMRIEYLKAGLAIAHRNWLFGVGTGDTPGAFAEEYVRRNSILAPEWRHRAHNEYLTLFISFGALGLLWCLFAWWWPAWRSGAWRSPYFIAWAIIFGISCLTDDTIETQAGATFFALYYALFVFAAPAPSSDQLLKQ